MQNENEVEKTIEDVSSLLEAHKEEWVERYCNYAELLQNNLEYLREIRSSFREWKRS